MTAAELFHGFTGFNMVFQINDPSQELLDEDEYLVPVTITKESLVNELEIALAYTTTKQFMSYKDVSAFYELYAQVFDKLEILKKKANPDLALASGKEMARILYETDSDDDCFPYDCIEEICNLVDPFQTDKKLWGYLECP